MPDEFRFSSAAENVEVKAYSRHFEHPGEEDEPSFRDRSRTFDSVVGNTDHEVEKIPSTVKIKNGQDGEKVTRVSVVPWD